MGGNLSSFAPIQPPGFEEPTLSIKIWAFLFGPGDMENGVRKKKHPNSKNKLETPGTNTTVQNLDKPPRKKKSKHNAKMRYSNATMQIPHSGNLTKGYERVRRYLDDEYTVSIQSSIEAPSSRLNGREETLFQHIDECGKDMDLEISRYCNAAVASAPYGIPNNARRINSTAHFHQHGTALIANDSIPTTANATVAAIHESSTPQAAIVLAIVLRMLFVFTVLTGLGYSYWYFRERKDANATTSGSERKAEEGLVRVSDIRG